ncbi:hypothetical protein Poly30_28040 [Planctomycetes bacterium Poly30]|uniref:Uncharacterized protein n=1 Tax=Saltatorellus ferox TaxID=2528018 RepID=A0A518ET84_9BACT|nr:hypothetical protein Poly30_28040 [Planctomycetes bacterium Poly30]
MPSKKYRLTKNLDPFKEELPKRLSDHVWVKEGNAHQQIELTAAPGPLEKATALSLLRSIQTGMELEVPDEKTETAAKGLVDAVNQAIVKSGFGDAYHAAVGDSFPVGRLWISRPGRIFAHVVERQFQGRFVVYDSIPADPVSYVELGVHASLQVLAETPYAVHPELPQHSDGQPEWLGERTVYGLNRAFDPKYMSSWLAVGLSADAVDDVEAALDEWARQVKVEDGPDDAVARMLHDGALEALATGDPQADWGISVSRSRWVRWASGTGGPSVPLSEDLMTVSLFKAGKVVVVESPESTEIWRPLGVVLEVG